MNIIDTQKPDDVFKQFNDSKKVPMRNKISLYKGNSKSPLNLKESEIIDYKESIPYYPVLK